MEQVSPHPAALDDNALLRQCLVTRCRASGPGGQHRNKVETAVEIRHQPSGLVGYAGERRSQEQNRHKALFRLRLNLALELRGYHGLARVPSDLWRSRCVPAKRSGPYAGGPRHGRHLSINPEHHDFPALLAEALDVLAALRFDPRRATLLLDCTASQLVKLLGHEPRALLWVNRQRQELGLRPLR